MPMSIKDQKLLYHLTSLDNLESILIGGLLARNDIERFDDVAEADIINFRQVNKLTQYVPFHFFAKNPFDGKVQKNFPEKEFIYICVSREFAKNNHFLIVPKHPRAMKPLVLHNYLEGYELIEWDIMNKRDYSDDNCRHICMAECLSSKPIKQKDFSHIFVRTDEIQDYVQELCDYLEISRSFHINVNPNMFVG